MWITHTYVHTRTNTLTTIYVIYIHVCTHPLSPSPCCLSLKHTHSLTHMQNPYTHVCQHTCMHAHTHTHTHIGSCCSPLAVLDNHRFSMQNKSVDQQQCLWGHVSIWNTTQTAVKHLMFPTPAQFKSTQCEMSAVNLIDITKSTKANDTICLTSCKQQERERERLTDRQRERETREREVFCFAYDRQGRGWGHRGWTEKQY